MIKSKGKIHSTMADHFASHAIEGERVEASVSFASGLVMNRYILTQLRLVLMDLQDAPKASFPLTEIVSVRTESSRLSKTLFISLRNSGEMKLGQMDSAIENELPQLLERLIEKSSVSSQLVSEAQRALWADEKLAKQDRKEQQKKQKADQKALDLQKYGAVVAREPFGTRFVTIYEKGYVKVSAGLGLLKGEVEELLDIFGETDITKKSGLGRAAGAVFTLGANITLSPNQRGNLYLTISTKSNTHSLMWDRPDPTSIKAMNKLVSAGKGTLARKNAIAITQSPQNSEHGADLANQLEKLRNLRDEGVLSEEEFSAAKAKLLEN